jgi:hypothetical protein
MVIHSITVLVPPSDHISTFLFLGMLLLAWNVPRGNAFGVRCSFVLSLLGVLVYLQHDTNIYEQRVMATFLNGLAVFSFLCQPALLRKSDKPLVTRLESWLLVLLSAAIGWLFVAAWVATRIHANYLTLGWALYAVFLFFFGLLVWERRLRWCGLAILVAAIVRVFAYDFWGFSNGYRVLTFLAVTVITLGLGFIYARFAERLKTWL